VERHRCIAKRPRQDASRSNPPSDQKARGKLPKVNSACVVCLGGSADGGIV
jgi:hypothetical protein